jgi:phosphoribosylformylglycinamidine synthase I
MATLRVLVLRAAGVNCDEESVFAFQTLGADAQSLHINQLIREPALLRDFQLLVLPGGFSYGDDIASGKILGNQLAHHLGDALGQFVDRGGAILGICNGFQVLVRCGLLPGQDCGVSATLTLNDSGRYEDRWVHVRAEGSNCIFLEPGEVFRVPVAHGEGKLLVSDAGSGIARLNAERRIALRYVAPDGSSPNYPENPNGSIENAAGLTDRTGRILGLMPHPERNILPCHAPDWTAAPSIESDGRRFFRRMIERLSR